MKIVDKIKLALEDPDVQKQQRELRHMFYLYKHHPDRMNLILHHRVINEGLASEFDEWIAQLTEKTPCTRFKTYDKVIGSVTMYCHPTMLMHEI